MLFAIADRAGVVCTGDHPSAREAWAELVGPLPDDPSAARSITLEWVSRGYRVVDRGGQGTKR